MTAYPDLFTTQDVKEAASKRLLLTLEIMHLKLNPCILTKQPIINHANMILPKLLISRYLVLHSLLGKMSTS